MSITSTVVLSSILVLIILVGENLCILTGVALKLGDELANQTNTRRWTGNTQEWPKLGQTHVQTANNFRSHLNGSNQQNNNLWPQSRINSDSRDFRLSGQEWPVVGEKRTTANWSNNRNYNNHYSISTHGNSFPSIGRDNTYLNSNVSFAGSLRNSNFNNDNVRQPHTHLRTTNHSFTGINFGEQNNDEVYNQQSRSEKRTNLNEVTDMELREFSEQLLLKDKNNAAQYVTINYQGRTTSRSREDEAPLPLLHIRNEVYNIPTIAKLLPLYDNYILKSDVNEDYTNQEKVEENALLELILKTDVMKATKKFLFEKGYIKNDREFQNLIHEMWFHQYSRGKRKVGSSGFEHVFVAEIKKNDVSGLHNWIYFEKEESNHRANYLGFLKKIDLGGKGAILKFTFDFHGINKPVGAMFIGTSPEFEMALYSMCFIIRADKICPLKLNGHRFAIRTYSFNYEGKKLIGSAFPDI